MFILVCGIVAAANANTTELHIGVQATFHRFGNNEYDLAEEWSRFIVSYINRMGMIQNYTLVLDYFREPVVSLSFQSLVVNEGEFQLSCN